MTERNEARYQLEQDNKVYILKTCLANDKLKLVCQDSNSQKYIGEFSMNDLLKLSRYFNAARNIEKVQAYLNGIIEKQRVGIFSEQNTIKIVLYLVNNDKITIPLNKEMSSINNFYNYENQYLQGQQSNIVLPTTTNNYLDSTYFSDQQLFGSVEPSYIYQQNTNDYLNNLNLNTQPYYIEQNINGNTNYTETGTINIPELSQINTSNNLINNQIISTPIRKANNLPININKTQLASDKKIRTYLHADASQNNSFNYNFQSNEKKIGELENNANMIQLEQEKIKNEMKRVLEESTKLREENESYKTENSSLINENNTLKNENENYRVQLLNYQNEIKKYKDENDEYKNKFVSIENDTNNYKDQNDELLKLKETYENENKSLKDNIEELNKENEILKGEIEELKHNLTVVSNENESLINDINNLKNSISSQKQSINEEEIKKLIEENSIFRIKAQENELLKKQIEDLQYQIKLGQEGEEDTQEVKGDIIHDMKELEMLTKKINKENKKIIINLLYKASADGDKASVFHEKCDNAKNTIVLVETKDGMRFGGYTTCSWSGNCVDKNDPEAFIFSFDKMKTYDNIPGDEAIGCYPKFGPIFLGCQIKIYDNAFVKGGTTFEKELNFNTEEDYELTGGKRSFEVKDIEVYEVVIE